MFSARKEMACPAALKMKLTIELMRPGRREPIFLPIVCSPLPMPLSSFFRALVNAPITAPIVTPAAKTMAVTVNPYFLKISVSLSRNGSFSRSFSFCSSRAATFCPLLLLFHVLSPLFPVVHFHCLQYLHLPLFLHCTCRLLLDFGQYAHVLTDRERL